MSENDVAGGHARRLFLVATGSHGRAWATRLGAPGYGGQLTWLNAAKNQISDVLALKDMTSPKARPIQTQFSSHKLPPLRRRRRDRAQRHGTRRQG